MIKVQGTQFIDENGRTVILRGVNLGGSTKVPLEPNGGTHLPSSLQIDGNTVSFVGRPFPEEEADEHFGRLRHWGFNVIRFLVTWEAIEPQRPQEYDHDYLDYVTRLIEKAGEYGLYVFVDSHQDVWSRFTGGDGAPGWTLEKVGFDLAQLHTAGAASLHQEQVGDYPDMRWVTNYNKLGAATMFTLFFAGNDFAPHTKIEGEPVQEYLQRHYIEAFKLLADRLKGMSHVLGYDVINEPDAGYVGFTRLDQDKSFNYKEGATPTPEMSFLLGAGITQTNIPNYVKRGNGLGTRRQGTVTLNREKRSVWREGMPDLWQHNKVWEQVAGKAKILRQDYFAVVNGRTVDFNKDYFAPFIEKFANAIRTIDPDATMFIEAPFKHDLPDLSIDNVVNANHWYDIVQLISRRYLPKIGVDIHKQRPLMPWQNIDQAFAEQIGRIKAEGEKTLNAPALLGEFGVSFDLDHKKAYQDKNLAPQLHLMDRTYKALDANVMSGTVWNYTADHSNEHGDNWNQEDLSIFSLDQMSDVQLNTDYDAGGRALGAFCRPYAQRTAGTPLHMSFDLETREFIYTFKYDPDITEPTEIYVPDYHYSIGIEVEVTAGECEYDQDRQILAYHPAGAGTEHTIRLGRLRNTAELVDRIEQEQSDEEYRWRKQKIATNGIQLHVVEAGPEDGELVILLHSFPEYWYGWREQIPYLARQGYRVVAPDLRGTNRSDQPPSPNDYQSDKFAADILGLIDHYDRPSAYIAGHGLGGVLAWYLADQHPTRVKKVAVLNMVHPAVLTAQNGWSQISNTFPQPPAQPDTPWWRRPRQTLEQSMITAGLPSTFTPEDWSYYHQAWQRQGGVDNGRHWVKTWAKESIKMRSAKIEVPVLILWGEKNTLLARDMVMPSLERCQDGRIHFFDHASHWLQHDEPDTVNLFLGRFFSESD